MVFWQLIARCACVCLLWEGRGNHGQGGKFEANRVEMQMMKQGEKEGDYAQPGCGTMAICIDANSSGWSRILLIFLFCWFSFLGETEAGMALAETHPDAQSTAIFLETVW